LVAAPGLTDVSRLTLIGLEHVVLQTRIKISAWSRKDIAGSGVFLFMLIWKILFDNA
jgi:hypothetical protein